MPTSNTRTSNHLIAASGGFTLLEILVVLTLAAILTSVVVIGFTGAEGGQRLEGETERAMLRMDLARQRAVQRNREVGMYVAPDGYRFAQRERRTGEWLALEGKPFTEVILDERFRMSLKVDGAVETGIEGKAPSGAGDDAEPLPDLVFFSSGEITPFTLTVETEDQRRGWEVSSDGLSGISMARIQ